MSNPSPLYGVLELFKAAKRDDFTEPEEPQDYLARIKRGEKLERPFVQIIREIDCYHGLMDGYPYKSNARIQKQRRKGLQLLKAPSEKYRYPLTQNMKFGWFYTDKEIMEQEWWKVPRSKVRVMADETRIKNQIYLDTGTVFIENLGQDSGFRYFV